MSGDKPMNEKHPLVRPVQLALIALGLLVAAAGVAWRADVFQNAQRR